MTHTVTEVGRGRAFIPKMYTVDITSYTTGGVSVSASALGLGQIDTVIVASSEKGFLPIWDKANGKLMAMWGDYSAASDGALIEPTAGTDCGTFELLVFGAP